MKIHNSLLILLTLILITACSSDNDNNNSASTSTPTPSYIFMTYNASLSFNTEGELITKLTATDDKQAANIAEIIQRLNPDVLLINEFDYDAQGEALRLFQENYLAVSQNGADAISFDYSYVAPSNTGVSSGYDLDNNGVVGQTSYDYANDSYGFGLYEGHYSFVILSKYPLKTNEMRTFQYFVWQDMDNASLPIDPTTGEYYYSAEELTVFRVSSKNHIDLPVELPEGTVHILAAHPTPPVFDGDEDKNGLRNHDEIKLFADYVTPNQGNYIVDDAGGVGGLAQGEHFVIMGDMNADPYDGDSSDDAILQFLDNEYINQNVTFGDLMPASEGGIEHQELQGITDHEGNPANDTSSFDLRVDYVLPSATLTAVDSAVFWPTTTDEYAYLLIVEETTDENGDTVTTYTSDHRPVWVEISLP